MLLKIRLYTTFYCKMCQSYGIMDNRVIFFSSKIAKLILEMHQNH